MPRKLSVLSVSRKSGKKSYKSSKCTKYVDPSSLMTNFAPQTQAFRKHCGNGNQHFLHFPQCFLPYERQPLWFILSSANAFNLDKAKILPSTIDVYFFLLYCKEISRDLTD